MKKDTRTALIVSAFFAAAATAAAAAATYQRKLNADNEAAAIATLRARGVQVNEHPDNAGIRKVVREETRQLFVQKNGDAVLRAMDAQR